MSRVERLRANFRGRVAGAVGTREFGDVEAHLASLEVAVPENLMLEVALEAQVSGLERAVADLASRRLGDGMGA